MKVLLHATLDALRFYVSGLRMMNLKQRREVCMYGLRTNENEEQPSNTDIITY